MLILFWPWVLREQKWELVSEENKTTTNFVFFAPSVGKVVSIFMFLILVT